MNQAAYLDEAVMRRAVTVGPRKPTPAQFRTVTESSTRRIGGFKITDPEYLNAELNRVLKEEDRYIDRYLLTRKAIFNKLADLNVTPIAVLPYETWMDIAKRAELITLMPNSMGNVFPDWEQLGVGNWAWGKARKTWHSTLHHIFPNGVAMRDGRSMVALTPILPEPPAEVAKVLVRAKAAGKHINTTAETSAIGFEQNIDRVRGNVLIQRKQDALEASRDPIVWLDWGQETGQTHCAVIIAQFGDFTIEKQVIDQAFEAEDALTR